MDMMQIRRAIMSASGESPFPTIGGLPVFSDNCLYTGNGKTNDVIEDSNFFLTGVVDTGNSANKHYTVLRAPTTGNNGAMRLFNDLSANSVDYWTIMRTDLLAPNEYSFYSIGQYIILSVFKEYAPYFYLKYYDGEYLLKGKNVT